MYNKFVTLYKSLLYFLQVFPKRVEGFEIVWNMNGGNLSPETGK